MSRRESEKPGLPAERTVLSWERSAFGFLVGGALVLLRQHGPLGPGRTVLALTATILAILVLITGQRRAHQIRLSPMVGGRTVLHSPRVAVLVVGAATVGFALVVVGALIFTAALG